MERYHVYRSDDDGNPARIIDTHKDGATVCQGVYVELRDLCATLNKYETGATDAQATVEALQRERDLYKHSSDTFAECVDNIREAMGLETTHYLVLPDDVGDMRKERDQLKLALDAEREKAKNDATAYRKLSEQWNAADLELSQLKALVRALPCLDGEIKVKTYHHESERGQEWDEYECGDAGFDNLEAANVYAALLRYRAALDATTPAECTNHFTDGSKIFPSRNCCSKGGDGE